MTLRLRLLSAWLRRVEKRRLARSEPEVARAHFERQGRRFRDPPYALYQEDRIGGIPVTWGSARPRRPEILLWIHGGAHVMGSPRTHRAMVTRIGAMTGLKAVLPDYRLAPEAPFPASHDDALAVWDGLVEMGHAPGTIILGGDSSGGGVMLSLLATLLARGQRPRAAVALAPFLDLTCSGDSIRDNAESDLYLPAGRIAEVCRLFLNGADPKDPRASALYARFPDCPPVFFQTASTEILRDDTLRMVAHLTAEGAAPELDLWGDLPHVWAMYQGWLPEADAAVTNIAGFIRRQLPALPTGGN
ncbi:alpha/beta hydrolase [Frigidibacter sp. ROC022]|uniref:alpha/beta hydrolase n=1 Tax=Frigidibacter sp. ROC022 TaxID=2971796 RepID=UPI00215A96C7|nr:alpha/beta hydrolase [Frigidibacter sp. ROC022]MCR8724020.1 alpha/beta hydrolase [Frigidibacter sp. ROC022]